MTTWLRDLMAALHFGVPHDQPDWERLKVVEDRVSRVEEDVEALRATVDALSWRRGADANHSHR